MSSTFIYHYTIYIRHAQTYTFPETIGQMCDDLIRCKESLVHYETQNNFDAFPIPSYDDHWNDTFILPYVTEKMFFSKSIECEIVLLENKYKWL